jgi:hypothetical protein
MGITFPRRQENRDRLCEFIAAIGQRKIPLPDHGSVRAGQAQAQPHRAVGVASAYLQVSLINRIGSGACPGKQRQKPRRDCL